MSQHTRQFQIIVFLLGFGPVSTALAQEPEGTESRAAVLDEATSPASVMPAPEPPPPPGAKAATPGAGTAGEQSVAGKGSAVVLGSESTSPASSAGIDVGQGGWKLTYHGFFRAPFRMGIGQRDPAQRAGLPRLSEGADDAHPTLSGPVIPPPGSRQLAADGSIVARDYDPDQAYKKTTYHVPLLPDDQTLSWQHTLHSEADWAEMFFSVGNDVAEGTLSIEAYDFTQSSFSNSEVQLGIGQGYVTIKPPLPSDVLRVSIKAGAHSNRYGMAGRYDAGQYDTYLFGRTKVMGITARETLRLGKLRLAFEEGFGGHRPHPNKANTGKFTLLGHGHAFLEYKGLMLGLHVLHSWAQEEDRDGQGCPGPSGVDDTTGLPTADGTCATLWGPPYGGGTDPIYPVGGVAGYGKFSDGFEGNVWLPDGRLTILGPELKFDTGPFGLIYFGYAAMLAKNALTVDRAVEVQHSDGGGFFTLGVTNNFLDNPQCIAAKGECSSGGTGQVHTLAFQYELSLKNLIWGLKDGSRFWGEGRDLVAQLYGMYSKVKSEYDVKLDGTYSAKEHYSGIGSDEAWRAELPNPFPNYWDRLGDNYSDHSKFKFGANLLGSLTPVLGAGLRFDRVMPNNHLPGQTFSILSPRIEFRSRWVTREKIWIQYSRYMYAKRECPVAADWNPYLPFQGDQDYDSTGSPQNFTGLPLGQDCVQYPSGSRLPDGWGATALEAGTNSRGAPITGSGGNPNGTRPDENVIQIGASMWW